MKPLRRDELVACAVLLGLFVLLRILAAPALAFDLLEPEELINLRLARQLGSGHPVGDLGRYWYTGVGGNIGAGPLVLSILYLLLLPFAEPDVGVVRLMGTLWACGGAVLIAAIGRRLLGRGGAVAGMAAAVAMPPTWLAWSLTAKGNYTEAAALTLLSAWLLLRLDAAEGSRRKAAWAGGLGLNLAFSGWFCVSAIPPAVLLGLIAPLAVGRRRWPAALALAGGIVMGLLPVIVGFAPVGGASSPVGTGEVRELFLSVLSSPGSWPRVFFGSLAALPVLGYGEGPAEDWARGWQLATSGVVLRVGIGGLGLLAGLGLVRAASREKLGMLRLSATGKALLLVLAGCALFAPAGLASLGFAPDGLGLAQLYFYDARRAALVYPVMAVGVATGGCLLWRFRVARALLVLALLFAVVNQGALATSGEGAPASFHPIRYMLCPSEQPVDEASVCVDALWEDQVAALEALVLRPGLEAPDARRQALQGFGALQRDEDRCELGAVPGGELAAFGLGVAVVTGCETVRAYELCARLPEAGACREGMEWGRDFGGAFEAAEPAG